MDKPRRAPKNGYSFKEKQSYREHVWSIFAESVHDVSSANVVFLPSKEGLEIPVALSHGFKEENLHAIDASPAILATAKWRKSSPSVKVYGGKVSDVSPRISKIGPVEAANLDLCGNLSWEMLKEVSTFIGSIYSYGDPIIAITMLRGRDSTAVNTLADMILEGKETTLDKRLHVLIDYVSKEKNFTPMVLGGGEYKSGNLRMCYGVFRLYSDCFLDKKILDYTKHLEGFARKLIAYEKSADTMRHMLMNDYKYESTKKGKRTADRIRAKIPFLLRIIDDEKGICKKEYEKFPYPHGGRRLGYGDFGSAMNWYFKNGTGVR